MSGIRWESIKKPGTDEVIGWELKGRYLPLKVLQDEGGHWFGVFEHGEDMPAPLVSTTHVAAKREFLKLCLRRARLVAAELERAWAEVGQTTLAKLKGEKSGR